MEINGWTIEPWADLVGAKLAGADLSNADLTGANLRMAKLTGADLTGANMRMADLANTIMPDGTRHF